jgi:DsbC/DsbD-like thiol-disulfide interchange protein
VIEGKAGWPPQITLKLKDGSSKKGRLVDFREPSVAEREKFSAA